MMKNVISVSSLSLVLFSMFCFFYSSPLTGVARGNRTLLFMCFVNESDKFSFLSLLQCLSIRFVELLPRWVIFDKKKKNSFVVAVVVENDTNITQNSKTKEKQSEKYRKWIDSDYTLLLAKPTFSLSSFARRFISNIHRALKNDSQ